jgi:very-short-patch-repair endonuclease
MISALEIVFRAQCGIYKLPIPEAQIKGIIPNRKFVFDFGWMNKNILVEIDGGEWSGGRHSRGKGMESDNVKINTAQALGYKVFRFTGGQVRSGYAVEFIEKYFKGEI